MYINCYAAAPRDPLPVGVLQQDQLLQKTNIRVLAEYF